MKVERKLRRYLAVFILPEPEYEHKEIINIIKDISKGDYKAAFFGGKQCVGYLFTSETVPWEIPLGKVLMNNDSLLVIELGDLFEQRNLRVAENWLTAHRHPAQK